VFASPNQFRSWASEQRRGILWEADGIESTVALTLDPAGYAFVVNGKSDGSARTDAGTQVMLGLLGALTVPNPKSALVIGLGTGSTAGWLGTVPSVDRVDVVELEPLVVEVARACALVNRDALSNPKVHVTIGDARELLLTTRDRYDIIASEPSNPYRAGVASLFTSEYYRAASDRLSDDGVFVQWIQAYEINANTLRTIYATLASVFPQVETWHTNPGDIVLVASKRTHSYAVADLTRRLNSEPFKSALAKVWRAVSIEGFLAHYLANQSLARMAANTPGVEINTDDRNVVEFGLARSVGAALTTVADIRTVAREAGASRPPLDTDSAIRWTELDTAWMSYNASVNSINQNLLGPPNEQARQAALLQYYQNSNLDAARGLWEQQPDGARDPAEMAMLADIASQSGVEAAVLFIDRLRAYQPGEADVMLGILRLRQSKLAESATAIESALVRFRTDPWTQSRYVYRALDVAMLLATRDAELARRMFAALGSPFAVDAAEDARLVTRAQVSRQLDLRGLCVAAVGALEPHVPWNEPFLRLRRDCYEATNHPLLQTAASDLDEFLKTAPRPIVSAP
jgi:spermidine synthase